MPAGGTPFDFDEVLADFAPLLVPFQHRDVFGNVKRDNVVNLILHPACTVSRFNIFVNHVILTFGEPRKPVFDPVSKLALAPDFSMEITRIDGVNFLFSDFCGGDVDDFVHGAVSCYFYVTYRAKNF